MPNTWLDRLEPTDIVDMKPEQIQAAAQASSAQSLKRIADALDRMAPKTPMQEGNEGR